MRFASWSFELAKHGLSPAPVGCLLLPQKERLPNEPVEVTWITEIILVDFGQLAPIAWEPVFVSFANGGYRTSLRFLRVRSNENALGNLCGKSPRRCNP